MLILYFIKKVFDDSMQTQCDPRSQFTCWNGDCISLNQRCDERAHCPDSSDEHSCRLVTFDKDVYRKTYVPRNPSEEGPLKIEVGFDVIDIVEINEAEVHIMISMKLLN